MFFPDLAHGGAEGKREIQTAAEFNAVLLNVIKLCVASEITLGQLLKGKPDCHPSCSSGWP